MVEFLSWNLRRIALDEEAMNWEPFPLPPRVQQPPPPPSYEEACRQRQQQNQIIKINPPPPPPPNYDLACNRGDAAATAAATATVVAVVKKKKSSSSDELKKIVEHPNPPLLTIHHRPVLPLPLPSPPPPMLIHNDTDTDETKKIYNLHTKEVMKLLQSSSSSEEEEEEEEEEVNFRLYSHRTNDFKWESFSRNNKDKPICALRELFLLESRNCRGKRLPPFILPNDDDDNDAVVRPPPPLQQQPQQLLPQLVSILNNYHHKQQNQQQIHLLQQQFINGEKNPPPQLPPLASLPLPPMPPLPNKKENVKNPLAIYMPPPLPRRKQNNATTTATNNNCTTTILIHKNYNNDDNDEKKNSGNKFQLTPLPLPNQQKQWKSLPPSHPLYYNKVKQEFPPPLPPQPPPINNNRANLQKTMEFCLPAFSRMSLNEMKNFTDLEKLLELIDDYLPKDLDLGELLDNHWELNNSSSLLLLPSSSSKSQNNNNNKRKWLHKCSHCGAKVTGGLKRYEVHLANFHDWKCSCGKTFINKSKIQQHIIDANRFPATTDDDKHTIQIKIKMEPANFECDLCDMNFKNSPLAVKHRGEVHGVYNNSFVGCGDEGEENCCPNNCGSSFKSQRQVKNHMKSCTAAMNKNNRKRKADNEEIEDGIPQQKKTFHHQQQNQNQNQLQLQLQPVVMPTTGMELIPASKPSNKIVVTSYQIIARDSTGRQFQFPTGSKLMAMKKGEFLEEDVFYYIHPIFRNNNNNSCTTLQLIPPNNTAARFNNKNAGAMMFIQGNGFSGGSSTTREVLHPD